MPILSECIVGRTLVLGSKLNYQWALPISSLDSVNSGDPVWSTSFLSCLLGILNPDIISILLLLLFRLGVWADIYFSSSSDGNDGKWEGFSRCVPWRSPGSSRIIQLAGDCAEVIKPGDIAPTWLVRHFTTAAGGASQRVSGRRSAAEHLGSPTRVRSGMDWETGNAQRWEVGWVRRGEGPSHPPRLFSGCCTSCFSSNRWKCGQFCCSALSTEEPDRLWPIGSQGAGHDWNDDFHSTHLGAKDSASSPGGPAEILYLSEK